MRRSPRRDRRVPDRPGRLGGAALRRGVEGEDDRVAGLQRQQALEDHGRGRVGHGSDARDDADRFGDLHDAVDLVPVHHPDRLRPGHHVGDVLAGEDVLDRLVLEDPAPGLLDGQDRERRVPGQRGQRSLLDYVVDLLLGEGGVLPQGRQGVRDQQFDCAGTGGRVARGGLFGLVRGARGHGGLPLRVIVRLPGAGGTAGAFCLRVARAGRGADRPFGTRIRSEGPCCGTQSVPARPSVAGSGAVSGTASAAVPPR